MCPQLKKSLSKLLMQRNGVSAGLRDLFVFGGLERKGRSCRETFMQTFELIFRNSLILQLQDPNHKFFSQQCDLKPCPFQVPQYHLGAVTQVLRVCLLLCSQDQPLNHLPCDCPSCSPSVFNGIRSIAEVTAGKARCSFSSS